jgi:hypothetical protein
MAVALVYHAREPPGGRRVSGWGGRLKREHVAASLHVAIAECSCGWTRMCTTEAEATGAADLHRLVHRVESSVRAVTTWWRP